MHFQHFFSALLRIDATHWAQVCSVGERISVLGKKNSQHWTLVFFAAEHHLSYKGTLFFPLNT